MIDLHRSWLLAAGLLRSTKQADYYDDDVENRPPTDRREKCKAPVHTYYDGWKNAPETTNFRSINHCCGGAGVAVADAVVASDGN